MLRGFVPPFTRGRTRRPAPWSTTLVVPAAPDTPSTPSPADAATAYYTLLTWVSARATKFDIFLDTVNPPVARAVIGYYVGTSYVPTLSASTTYYWKIVAYNDGGSAAGPVWSFTTPAAAAVLFSLAGTIVTSRARFGSLTIHDVINAAPNTASLLFDTTAPTAGQAVKIGLGTLDATALLFGGEIQSIDQSYVDTALATLYPVNLIDYTFAINKRRPFGTWTSTSATTIAQYLVATFAPGFTYANVQVGLPAVSINFDGQADFMSCMLALAQAASTSTAPCYTYVDYAKDLHLSNRAETTATPTALSLTNPPLNTPSPIAFSTDLSQIRTRVYGKGNAQTTPTDVAARETIVPLGDVSLFTTTGGRAIAGTTAGGAQTEILTYAGVQLGGGGSLVGPGVAPTTGPTVTPATGTGIESGSHDWAIVWGTAAGRTLPSPLTTGRVGTVTAPTFTPVIVPNNGGGFQDRYAIGDTVEMVFTYSESTSSTDFSNESAASTSTGSVVVAVNPTTGGPQLQGVTLQYTTSSTVQWIHLWLRVNGGSYTFASTQPNLFTTGTLSLTGSMPSASGIWATTLATARGNQAALSGVSVGPTGTTYREIYRTAAGGSQLKLQQTIANNTATVGVQDATADASLGANAPTSDTSGLTLTTGQVNAGSTSLLTASATPFSANGGWAILSGGQTVRYTGVSTNTLTGIPASGAGSITTTVLYGSQVLPAPALTGVNSNNGLTRAMAKGSTVAIWVQRDDTSAQAALGLLELDDNGVATDGIREYTITDGRMNETGIAALCDADLALFSGPIVSATYYTRDKKSASGKTVAIDLVSGTFDPVTFDPATFDVAFGLGIAGTFVIQDVTITFDGPGLNPLYQVKASSVSFTLSDLLRRVALV